LEIVKMHYQSWNSYKKNPLQDFKKSLYNLKS